MCSSDLFLALLSLNPLSLAQEVRISVLSVKFAVAVDMEAIKSVSDDFISSGLHCTGKIFENNCCHFTVCLSGYFVGWLSVKWGKMFHCAARRKRDIHADSDAVLYSHIWSNFV